MERYLFRGKQIYGFKKWVAGHYVSVPRPMIVATKTMRGGGWDADDVDPTTIGQCTGLKDKNGRLIFEGDIFKQDNGVVCVVEWLSDGWYAYYRHLILHVADDIEIIGNIHDNPELLDKEAHP